MMEGELRLHDNAATAGGSYISEHILVSINQAS